MKRRTNNRLRRIAVIVLKAVVAMVMFLVLVVAGTSVSPVYDFPEPTPFSGPDIFNPYRNLDTTHCWKRANFHTHTRVEGLANECEVWPEGVWEEYEKYGYDIVTFSNHNAITIHPFDENLQVNVYEHGYNLLKYHKLVFGSKDVNGFDHLLPIFAFQRQWQMDMLLGESDIVMLNHPLRTPFSSRSTMERLSGYHIMELDSGKSTENEYWDWALSAGHYSFGLANDDLHDPYRSSAIAVRSNFLCTPSGRWEDIRRVLLEGCYYSMRTPDYGSGDWEVKRERNKSIPEVEDIGLRGDTIFIRLSEVASSIEVIGQNHTLLLKSEQTDVAEYKMERSDPYARFVVRFPEGEVIYSNPFARYNADFQEIPRREPAHRVNVTLTVLWNTLLLVVVVGIIWGYRLLFRRRR